MDKFEIVFGDAIFLVSVPSRSQNHFNTPINLPHFHIDDEIHIVLDGEAIMEIDGVDSHMKAGDIHVIPKNVCHYYKEHNDSFNKISFLYTLSRNGDSDRGFSEYEHYSEIFGFRDGWIALTDGYLTSLGRELFSLDNSPENDHIQRAIYAIFFISLAKLIKSRTAPSSDRESISTLSHEDPRDQKRIIETFFFKRFGENVTIEDLARELYRSVPQTHRIVKHYFNDNFKTILVKQRMEQACLLVKQGKMKFCDVAPACGYNSYNGFLAAFKKYTGKTPEEYQMV